MRKRTLSREFALKVLYQYDLTKKPLNVLAEEFLGDQPTCRGEVLEFCKRLVFGVEEHLADIDQKIVQYSANWQFSRMAVVDRNILRIGIFELLFATDVPPKVTINEAVELAKKFGDIESSKFVNGILDQIHKREILSQPPAN